MPPRYLENVQLYHFTTCPFCIKVRLAMKIMGISMECKNIHANDENRARLIAGGGKPQVPCLRIVQNDAVRWLYESSDIIQYLKRAK